MEVHPPHHPLNTWRDFFVHIATITIGLLIALGLEAGVEALHHRNIVREARENIRHEFELNEAAARDDLGYLQADMNNMHANIDTARLLESSKDPNQHFHMDFNFTWSDFNESAWISARDSGALTYMPTDEVQRYADSYNEQEIVQNQAVSTFTSETELSAPFMFLPDKEKPTPEDMHALIHGCAVTYTRLSTLHQLVDQLGKSYAGTLKK